MINHSKILLAGIAVTLCLSALLIFPVGASGMDMSAGTGPVEDGISDFGQQMVTDLALLEEQGIDVTEIRTAFESGDPGTLHERMDEFYDEGLISDEGQFSQTVDEICAGEYGPSGDRIGERKRVEQVEGHISMFEVQGIDVTDLRTAFKLGDMDTVRALMAELRDECMPEGAVNCCDEGNVTDSGLILEF